MYLSSSKFGGFLVFMNCDATVNDIMAYFISWRSWSRLLKPVWLTLESESLLLLRPFPTCYRSWKAHGEGQGCRRVSSCWYELNVIRIQFSSASISYLVCGIEGGHFRNSHYLCPYNMWCSLKPDLQECSALPVAAEISEGCGSLDKSAL